MAVFQLPSLSPEIPLRFTPKTLTDRRIKNFRSLLAISDSRSGAPDSESKNRMFILGMGFVGGYFLQQLKEEGWVVSGTCRSDSKKKECWSVLDTVKDYTLISIPPIVAIGDPILRSVQLVRDKREHLSKGQMRRTSWKFTSRVHVEDICQALQAATEKPLSGEIYNIVDDDPAPKEEVFGYALELIEKRWPGNIKTKPFPYLYESPEESLLRGEKRVHNEHMKNKLGVKLLYHSYKSGLQSIVEKMDNPF